MQVPETFVYRITHPDFDHPTAFNIELNGDALEFRGRLGGFSLEDKYTTRQRCLLDADWKFVWQIVDAIGLCSFKFPNLDQVTCASIEIRWPNDCFIFEGDRRLLPAWFDILELALLGLFNLETFPSDGVPIGEVNGDSLSGSALPDFLNLAESYRDLFDAPQAAAEHALSFLKSKRCARGPLLMIASHLRNAGTIWLSTIKKNLAELANVRGENGEAVHAAQICDLIDILGLLGPGAQPGTNWIIECFADCPKSSAKAIPRLGLTKAKLSTTINRLMNCELRNPNDTRFLLECMVDAGAEKDQVIECYLGFLKWLVKSSYLDRETEKTCTMVNRYLGLEVNSTNKPVIEALLGTFDQLRPDAQASLLSTLTEGSICPRLVAQLYRRLLDALEDAEFDDYRMINGGDYLSTYRHNYDFQFEPQPSSVFDELHTRLGDVQTDLILKDYLHSQSDYVRRIACRWFYDIVSSDLTEVATFAQLATNDTDDSVRFFATQFLVSSPTSKARHALVDMFLGVGFFNTTEQSQQQRLILENLPGSYRRTEVLMALVKLLKPTGEGRINNNPYSATQALMRLGRHDGKVFATIWADFLSCRIVEEGSFRTLQNYAQAIGKFTTPKALFERLNSLAETDEPKCRLRAVVGLHCLRKEFSLDESRQQLVFNWIEYSADTCEHWEKQFLIECLGGWKEAFVDRALCILCRFSFDESPDIAMGSTRAFARYGPAAIPYLPQLLKDIGESDTAEIGFYKAQAAVAVDRELLQIAERLWTEFGQGKWRRSDGAFDAQLVKIWNHYGEDKMNAIAILFVPPIRMGW